MSQVISLPYPPSVNHYWIRKGKGMGKSERAIKYRVDACRLLGVAQVKPIAGPVCLTLRFYRGRQQGDLDNGLKAVLDALIGYAYADDSQVVRLQAERYEDRRNPRVEIEIHAASETKEGSAL